MVVTPVHEQWQLIYHTTVILHTTKKHIKRTRPCWTSSFRQVVPPNLLFSLLSTPCCIKPLCLLSLLWLLLLLSVWYYYYYYYHYYHRTLTRAWSDRQGATKRVWSMHTTTTTTTTATTTTTTTTNSNNTNMIILRPCACQTPKRSWWHAPPMQCMTSPKHCPPRRRRHLHLHHYRHRRYKGVVWTPEPCCIPLPCFGLVILWETATVKPLFWTNYPEWRTL